MYLELDVALLSDVFEAFRKKSHSIYGLDPVHYYTLPSYSWDALFKHTGVELDLLTDVDMYIAFEKAMRGGVCAVSHRHIKANNPKVEGYDNTKPTTWLRYDDANNLYGWAMNQHLPMKNFKWGNPEEWNTEKIMMMSDTDVRGCQFEVDIEYPKEIHDSHSDYPILPETMEVPYEWLSDYAKDVCGGKYVRCNKLVPNLMNKTKYWVHYRNLKFAISQGLKLTKIHRVIEYEQADWMAKYIMFNTKMRTEAKSDFEKDLYKLMNNAVFGKTMENLRSRRDIQIIKVATKTFIRWVANPSFVSRKCINNNLVIAERNKSNLILNKPVYAGASILDLSKLHMWKFWYEEMRVQYPSARLCYADTDSLIYSIISKTEPRFDGSSNGSFDNSDYPKDHIDYCADNKKVIGKFKDEAKGVPIAEFVGLRPKLYSLRLDKTAYELRGDKDLKYQINKSKGTQRAVVKNKIRMEDYINVLTTGKSLSHRQVNFRTDAHQIYTTSTVKTSLSAFDGKRYLTNSISSLPFGHHKIVINK
jgi:hypothetical protein